MSDETPVPPDRLDLAIAESRRCTLCSRVKPASSRAWPQPEFELSKPKDPSSTSHLFVRNQPTKLGLTSERLEADLAAFQKRGGVIEKLGNTCKLKTVLTADATRALPVLTSGRTRRPVADSRRN